MKTVLRAFGLKRLLGVLAILALVAAGPPLIHWFLKTILREPNAGREWLYWSVAILVALFVAFFLTRSKYAETGLKRGPAPKRKEQPAREQLAKVRPPRVEIEYEVAPPAGPWASVKVFFATDRDGPTQDVWEGISRVQLLKGFSAERSPGLSFGTCEVSIPASHKIGTLESPSIFKLQFVADPEKHITLLYLAVVPERYFYGQVAARVSASVNREAFVFIHGYNVTFEDAVRRTAQIAYDLNFDGAPILYSWPSAGDFWAYPKDETNVEWTVPHLRQFLLDLSERSGATTIHLIAHSMGNRALARVLHDWGAAGEPEAPFRHVVLTAPDIDADTFKGLAAAIRLKAGQVTVYSSHLDKALVASKKFHGYPRAGEIIVIVRGIDTIDASAVNTSFLGHSHFAESRSVIEDIYWLFRNQPPESRFGIRTAAAPDGLYYVFRP